MPGMLRSRITTSAAILVLALAAWAALADRLEQGPRALAGYSVGELPAFACAGVLAPAAALALARQRAALMDAAVAGRDTGLLSVSGMPAAQLLQAYPALDCAIAIGADQGIYAGERSALDACAARLTEQGTLCKLLEVRVASHSRWMRSAALGFAAQLEAVCFARPRAALVLNASGASTRDPQVLRGALAVQIDHMVQWAACMDTLAEQGVDCVMEIGGGSTLARMWNQRHPEMPARSLEDFRDAAGAGRWLQRNAVSG